MSRSWRNANPPIDIGTARHAFPAGFLLPAGGLNREG
jgi:hypothetical protein